MIEKSQWREVNGDEATGVADWYPGRDAGGLVSGGSGFLCGAICAGSSAAAGRYLRLLRLHPMAGHVLLRERVLDVFHDDPSLLLQSLPCSVQSMPEPLLLVVVPMLRLA